jgi:KDO2-lipid IV(A) lauroyltransferase
MAVQEHRAKCLLEGEDRRGIEQPTANSPKPTAYSLKPKAYSWSPGQRLKNAAIYGLAAAAMWVVGRLPHRLALSVGAAAGLIGWALAPGERRKALASLEIAFPEASPADRRRTSRRCFASLGRRAAEVCRMHRLALRSHVQIPPRSRERIDAALARGRGLLWVTAHFGNWELLAAGLGAHGYDVRPVATPSYDPRFTTLIDRWRRRNGVTTIWRGMDDVAAGVAGALREGAVVGLLMDQDTRTRGHFVPFFGRLAWTPGGPAELARLSGAPVLVGFIEPAAEGGHVISVTEPELSRGGDPAEDDLHNTAVLTAAIEEAVRRRPADWVWMHERWRTRPAAPALEGGGE